MNKNVNSVSITYLIKQDISVLNGYTCQEARGKVVMVFLTYRRINNAGSSSESSQTGMKNLIPEAQEVVKEEK